MKKEVVLCLLVVAAVLLSGCTGQQTPTTQVTGGTTEQQLCADYQKALSPENYVTQGVGTLQTYKDSLDMNWNKIAQEGVKEFIGYSELGLNALGELSDAITTLKSFDMAATLNMPMMNCMDKMVYVSSLEKSVWPSEVFGACASGKTVTNEEWSKTSVLLQCLDSNMPSTDSGKAMSALAKSAKVMADAKASATQAATTATATTVAPTAVATTVAPTQIPTVVPTVTSTAIKVVTETDWAKVPRIYPCSDRLVRDKEGNLYLPSGSGTVFNEPCVDFLIPSMTTRISGTLYSGEGVEIGSRQRLKLKNGYNILPEKTNVCFAGYPNCEATDIKDKIPLIEIGQ